MFALTIEAILIILTFDYSEISIGRAHVGQGVIAQETDESDSLFG